MTGWSAGQGTGSAKSMKKSVSDISKAASSDVAMDSALEKSTFKIREGEWDFFGDWARNKGKKRKVIKDFEAGMGDAGVLTKDQFHKKMQEMSDGGASAEELAKFKEEQTAKLKEYRKNYESSKKGGDDKSGDNEGDSDKKKVEPGSYVKPGGKATGNMKDYAIGSEARKKEYDARGWKYDETIAGYNRDGSKKEEPKEEPKTEATVENDPNAQTASPEKPRSDRKRRRQKQRIAKRLSGAGEDPVYDARTLKKAMRMKYGRDSKEFKEAKKNLKIAKIERKASK